ncbi:efflux RND transporter periplasmic adaptor subunit [Vibrio sp. TBV020]|uniref:efflux RND transporter periplasmic adaptor subunit n=1 Tax=Vibrio sp. TBV020 TaxID=3137398 RepID=UPI0038CD709B
MNRLNSLGIAVGMALGLTGCNQAQVVEQPQLSQKTIQVIELADTQSQSAKHFSGVVHSQETAGLAFRVPGTITQIYVKKGQSVEKGDLIAELDPHDYQVTLEELQARKLEAESAHKLAKAELKRVKQATQDDAIASVNLDRAISGYERSLSAIKVVDKNIQRAKDTLNYTQLRAPFDGVIGSVDFDTHEQVLPGIAVATLQDNLLLEVEVDVPENMIEAFEVGQKGAVSWYQSKTVLNAQVTEIAPLPHLIKQTYTVTYRIDSTSKQLFPGKSVSLTTHLTSEQDAFCVPYSAIVGEKQNMHVNLIRKHQVVRTPVELQSLDAYQACVMGEMHGGDYVVVSGSHYLADGDRADKLVVRLQ